MPEFKYFCYTYTPFIHFVNTPLRDCNN